MLFDSFKISLKKGRFGVSFFVPNGLLNKTTKTGTAGTRENRNEKREEFDSEGGGIVDILRRQWYHLGMKCKRFFNNHAAFCILASFSLGVTLLGLLPNAGDYFSGVHHWAVWLLGKCSGLVSFSVLAVTVAAALPLFACVLINFVCSRRKRKFLWNVFSFLLACYLLFQVTVGSAYHKTSIYEHLGFSSTEISTDRLRQCAQYFIATSNDLAATAEREADGTLKRSTCASLSDAVNDAVCNLKADWLYGLRVRHKNFFWNNLMADFGITGIFFPFYGEVNVNEDVGMTELPFVMLHETAHANGVMNEGEANFVAFYAGMQSSTPILRYSASLYAMRQTLSLARGKDAQLYKELAALPSEKVRQDLQAAEAYYDKHDGWIADVSEFFNNLYLKWNGISSGTGSYSETSVQIFNWYVTQKERHGNGTEINVVS